MNNFFKMFVQGILLQTEYTWMFFYGMHKSRQNMVRSMHASI